MMNYHLMISAVSYICHIYIDINGMYIYNNILYISTVYINNLTAILCSHF